MRAISTGPRRTLGSANSTCPRGRLPKRVSRRPRPLRVRAGIRVRANTQGCSSHSNWTSRVHAQASKRSRRAPASSRPGRVQRWLSTRTPNRPAQTWRKRWVNDPASSNQADRPAGISRGNSRERGYHRGGALDGVRRSACKMVVSKVIRFSEAGNYGMVAGHRGNGTDGAVVTAVRYAVLCRSARRWRLRGVAECCYSDDVSAHR